MSTRSLRVFCALAGSLSVFAISAAAATSTTWETTGFNDFLKGRISGLSLTADGTLQLGPATRWQTSFDQPALWSLAAAPDHTIYASTGHTGKVFRITAGGRFSTVWTAEQPEVFAICITRDGVLYAGTSPNGGVYRIRNGSAEEIWHSPAKYIWALQAAADGALYAATGEPGRIYRITPDRKFSLYYETGQANVTALTLGSDGHVYAGTDPNGLLYDIAAPGQGTILYDSSLPEIRSIVIDPTGVIYAAAMGGALSTRSGAPASAASTSSGAVVATTPTVITVTESNANGVPSDNEQTNPKSAATQAQSATSSSISTGTASNTAVVEVSGVEKSAIYRIRPNHAVETIRSSKDDNVYDLLLDGNTLFFSTDDHGRIYRMDDDRSTLLAEPGIGETTRLLAFGNVLYAAMSNPARLFAFGPAGSGPGSYESQVHDSISVARWGHLQWRSASSAPPPGIVFRTRTGNAARPDETWSSWSAPIHSSDTLIKSPPARFIQWRAEWVAGSSAQIDAVDVPYLPQNAPPVIHSITITSVIGTNPAKVSAGATSSSAYSVTVTDTGAPPAATTTTSDTQTVSRLQTTQTQISWQADDPDGDKLVYSLYFRAEDEKDWQLVRSRMFENTLLLDPDVFADGRYFFRVVASDAPSNAPEYAHEAEMISTPVLIDNTPPVVTLGSPHRDGTTLDIDVDAVDKISSLRLCEYSLDAGFWQPIEAVDGVTDSPHERFHLHFDRLRPGEHLLVFRVYDIANNAGLARVVLH